MKKLFLFSLLIVSLMILPPVTAERDNIMYIETIDSYSRVDGRTYKWNMEREFTISDYSVYLDNNTEKMANIVMMDDSEYGLPHNVSQPYKAFNFNPTARYLDNGSIEAIEWEMFFVRDFEAGGKGSDPFDKDSVKLFTGNADHRRYDVKSNTTFFTANLQYLERLNIDTDDELEILKVNTEVSTNNREDGYIIRSAIHIIKRDANQDIVFEYSRSIQMVDKLSEFINIFDQPALYVPFKLGIILAFVFAYIKASKLYKKYDISIKKKSDEEKIKEDEKS